MATGRMILTACFAGLLTACVSMEYGAAGPDRPYGYKETKRDDGTWVLAVAHPDPKKALEFWDRRARELCGSAAYVKNIYQAIRPTVWTPGYSAFAGTPHLEGYLTCGTGGAPTTVAPDAAPAVQSAG